MNIRLLRDFESRRAASEDFGRLACGDAWGVALPSDIDELCATIAFAGERGLAVTVRGRGYSQSGQSLPAGGLSLDCTRLDRIGPIDQESASVRCEGGARLREVVLATAACGFLPPVLPLNLDMTIGGLLSAGGIGSTSHRYGPVVANILDIEVVTAAAERVRCSSSENTDLFHAVLSGAGRCAVIASARLALRRFQPRTQTYHLLYGSIEDWLDDQRLLSRSGFADHLEGFCWASARWQDRGRPRTHWLYGLQVGVEHDNGGLPPNHILSDARCWRRLHTEDTATLDFAFRYQPRFDAMRESGDWEQSHPWLEFLLPADELAEVLPGVLDMLPLSLGDGHRLILVAGGQAPPLFPLPTADAACFAVLPMGVAFHHRDRTLEALRAVDRRLREAGGERYLSGWLFDRAGTGRGWLDAKRKFDPRGIFSSVLFAPVEQNQAH